MIKKDEKLPEKYNIGLDIGTASVGWAVTDEENKLISVRGNRPLWGTRLFEEASTAESTRLLRSSRRRMNRKKERIRMLQNLLAEDVLAKDSNFYTKLSLSKYYKDDYMVKKNENIQRTNLYNLFNDDEFNDKSYYKQFPTIYHLRDYVINAKEKVDIRLVYLAIHHILKYRGNFLHEGETFEISNTASLKNNFKEVFAYIIKDEDMLEVLDNYSFDDVFNIFMDSKLNKREKQEKVENILSKYFSDYKKEIKTLVQLIIGYSADLRNIFNIEKTQKIRLSDEIENEVEILLGNNIEILYLIKNIYSWYIIQDILKGDANNISESFIKKYDEYNKHLKLLKEVYKKYLPQKYSEMFRKGVPSFKKEGPKNYKAYNKGYRFCSYDEIKSTILKDLEPFKGNITKINKVIEELENETFLKKINTTENGAIPYQLHKIELEKILKSQLKYYKLIDKNSEKIISLLEFRIPYYVGPLKYSENRRFSWSIRKEGMVNEKVYPWNFEDIIDVDNSAEQFILRMTNKCKYIPDKDVIPKESLLYSNFRLFNELNNIRIITKSKIENKVSIQRLPVTLKEKLIEEVFKSQKTVKEKKLKEFLEINGFDNIIEIRGFQKEREFASKLDSYIDFKKILGCINNENIPMIEELISWITIFEDKKILKRKIQLKYKDKLSEEQIKEICKKRYIGWSTLSKELLTEIKVSNEFAEKKSIMDVLRNTNENFMEIINNKEYGFKEILEKFVPKIENKKINEEFYNENVKELFTSPANKRGIWQTLKIVNEIIKIMGKEPEKIYIEFSRSDDEKTRTSSRTEKLSEAYKKIKIMYPEMYDASIVKNLKTIKQFNEKLFLYYLQNGKCLYSGKSLDLSRLELYEVDHIIPRSYLKDDSFSNKALVIKSENQRKRDDLVLNINTIRSQKENWKKLKDCGLIDEFKYNNLIREKATEELKERFLRRQLVETSQIIKYVANILENIYENTDIFSIKAALTHSMREKYNIVKIREVNDYHHAQDAYIISTIGYSINKIEPEILKKYIYGQFIKSKKKVLSEEKENKKYKYEYPIHRFSINQIDNETGELIWDARKEENNFLKQLKRKEYYLTKKLEEGTGAFYDQTIESKKAAAKKEDAHRIKEDLEPSKYGSYNNENKAYFVLAQYVKDKKSNIKILGIPIIDVNKIDNNEKLLKEYLKDKYNFTEVNIIMKKILKYQLILKNNMSYYLTSDVELRMAKQLKLDNITIEYLKEIFDEEYIDDYKTVKVYEGISNKIEEQYELKVGKLLKEKILEFEKLILSDKKSIIKDMLKYTSGSRTAFKKLDIKEVGRFRCSIDEKNLSDAVFVQQSITGVYEKRFSINELENSNNI